MNPTETRPAPPPPGESFAEKLAQGLAQLERGPRTERRRRAMEEAERGEPR